VKLAMYCIHRFHKVILREATNRKSAICVDKQTAQAHGSLSRMASYFDDFAKDTVKSARKKQSYASTLSADVKKRYDRKISVINDRDPYEIAKKDWLHDVTKYPDISYFDICNYLVYTISYYTQDEMRAYKSLDAYNYFIHGWVQDVSNILINDLCLLTAKVSVAIFSKRTVLSKI